MAVVKSERLGLLMVCSSLVAIVVVTGLLFHGQREARLSQIRGHGSGLVRILTQVPYEDLAGPGAREGLLRVLEHDTGGGRAYVAVVDPEGRPLLESMAPGVSVPATDLPASPSWLLREERLSEPGGGRALLEYCAPVYSGGQLAAFVRAGYFEPSLLPAVRDVPFFASLALPVFLLTPLFYVLVRREIRPIGELNRQIQAQVDSGVLPTVRLDATGEMREFIERFNEFARRAEDHIQELELSEKRMLTSSKILTYQKARTEAALQALPDAAFVLDEAGAVTFANAKVRLLLGYEPAEAQGKRPHEWCSDETLVSFLAQFNGGPTLTRGLQPMEFTPTHAPERCLEVSGYPLFSPKDASTRFGTLVICRDATDQALAKRARAEFVARVAHELKSPLNVLGMYAEQLAGEDGASVEFRVEAVNVIQDEVDRLSTLIRNLLNITKIEMGSITLDRQRVKLGELLKDLLETTGRSGKGAGIKLELDLPPDLGAVSLDKDLFRVALSNLLSNAVKYSRPGGTVTLSADEDAQEIRIAVRDEGIGISPADGKRIFEKFFRSEDPEVRSRTGHGLGLSLVKDIVDLHHGRVDVESRVGEGSEFIVRLRKGSGLVESPT